MLWKPNYGVTILGLALLAIAAFAACTPTTPTPSSSPTTTETTATPLPPKPKVPYTPIPPETLSPIVIWRTPQRGESLPPDGEIELTFDKPMDRKTVAAALRIHPAGQDTPIEGQITWVDARTLRFRPAKPLPRATTFDVILSQEARAASGEPLKAPYLFRFTTAGYLEVAQVIPAPDTADVETDATITVIFNRPVVPLTTLQQMDKLPHPLSFDPPIEGEGEWLNTAIYTFRPATPLPGGTTYRVTVKAGLQDTGGAELTEDYTWQFTTAPPTVLQITPRDGSTLVDIKTAITVRFNQPIDPETAQQAFSLTRQGLLGLSAQVKGSFTVQGATLVFTPSRPLDFDTTYTVRVEPGVTSHAGGVGMRQAATAQFTTVPLPKIVRTIPANGEQKASPHTSLRIVFNAPIDPTTVMPNIEATPPLSPAQVYTYYSSYDHTFTLEFGAKPSTDYTFVIKDGIADPYGNTIPKGRTVHFRTAPLPPTYELRVPGHVGTYDAAMPAQLVVGYINLHRLDLQLYRLPLKTLREHGGETWWGKIDPPPDAELLRRWTVTLEAPLNARRYTAITLGDNPQGTLTPGVYLLIAEAPEMDKERYDTQQTHLLVVSNLNLTLKAGTREALVWATDLATGQPVADLTLTFVGMYNEQKLGTATTDAHGIARLDLPRERSVLLVYTETPFAAVAEGWGRGIGPWDFGLPGGEESRDYRTYLYTDRPLYRPGQTIHFKGLIRAEDDAAYTLPDIPQINVTLRNPAYEEIFNQTLPLNELGTFEGDITLDDNAPLGTYILAVQYADFYDEQRLTVAAYRPPEFEVIVETDGDEIQRGTNLQATIRARYFFGGPLADATVRWNITAERYTFRPPWGGRYSFDDVDDPFICYRCWWWEPPTPPEPLFTGEGTTDAQGKLTIALAGDTIAQAVADQFEGTFRPVRLTVEATATGPDNQPIAGRTSLILHPGPYYIGLSPRTYVGRAARPNAIDLVVVDWNGQRLPGKTIRLRFYRREWINTFIENEFGGGHWTWETKETLVDDLTVTTDALGEAVANFTPPEGGVYHVVATPADPTPETEAIRTSIFVWVAGKDHIPWRRENHDRITLISDKTEYHVGDTAEILIPSPFDGEQYALITVERGNVRRYEVVRLEGNSAIYRLPIEAGDIPNIYLSVVLIKGRGEKAAGFKMGLLSLDVAPDPVTLHLNVESTAQARPGDDVTLTLTATDAQGTPIPGAELSLDLVDKAVLTLRPRTQDILHTLYARRALQVNTASGLSLSVNRYLEELDETTQTATNVLDAGAVRATGAEEVSFAAPPMATQAVEKSLEIETAALSLDTMPDVTVRQTFADTAFWTPILRTDDAGRASVTLTLPDNLTTWVVRSVGLTADTIVGEGTAEIVAAKPLMVRPVAPRFFVVDDRAQLAANVTNNTDTPLPVVVSLHSDGLTLDGDTPARQTVTIPAHQEHKVTWWVRVTDVPQTTLTFQAVALDANGQPTDIADASTPRLTTGPDGTLLVLRYTTPDIVGTAGQLTAGGARTEAIALPPTFDEHRGQLTIHLDPSLAAGMQEGLRYLEHYPYECTEQTVSRFLPNLLTYRALTSLGLENAELKAKLPTLIDEGLTKLYAQQNPDGGWGWWHDPQNPRSNVHVSGYVVFAMLKAQEAGWQVKREALERGLQYLRAQLEKPRPGRFDRTQANTQAWILYVLAESGTAPADTLDALYQQREQLSHYARAFLAQALWLGNTDDPRLLTLLSDLNNAAILSATGAHWEETGYGGWAMNTDTRSTAIILDTLAKLDPDNALIPNIVRWLMIARKTGIWETTQETAWALIALTDWMVTTGELNADYDFALYLNDVARTTGTATRDTVQESIRLAIPIAELHADKTNTLTIARSDGPGRLYYTAHLEVYQPVEQVEPADRGIVVQRRYTLASCAQEKGSAHCPDVREIRLGDTVQVDLTIIVPHDRYYLVVEDPLPAGGEAIDPHLATTSLLERGPALRRNQDTRWQWWWQWFSRSELRDDKVVLFADYLRAGTYTYTYTFRATLPGDYHVMPTVAREFYFPEVFGRSDGRLLTIAP